MLHVERVRAQAFGFHVQHAPPFVRSQRLGPLSPGATFAWGHFRLGPLSPGATFAWGHFRLGPLSPGATFAWGHFRLGPLSPGATFAWGHFRLGATFDPRITRVPPTSRAKPPAKSRASRSTAHRRPRRPLPRDGPSLETAPPSRRPLPRDGPSLETAPPSRRPSLETALPRDGPPPEKALRPAGRPVSGRSRPLEQARPMPTTPLRPITPSSNHYRRNRLGPQPPWSLGSASPRPRFARPRFARPRFARPRFARPRFARPRFARPRFARPRFARPRFARPRFARPRFARPRFARPRFAQIHVPSSLALGALRPPASSPKLPPSGQRPIEDAALWIPSRAGQSRTPAERPRSQRSFTRTPTLTVLQPPSPAALAVDPTVAPRPAPTPSWSPKPRPVTTSRGRNPGSSLRYKPTHP
jgi:hypothetical protein